MNVLNYYFFEVKLRVILKLLRYSLGSKIMFLCSCARICVRACACMCAWVRADTFICVSTSMCVCMHAYVWIKKIINSYIFPCRHGMFLGCRKKILDTEGSLLHTGDFVVCMSYTLWHFTCSLMLQIFACCVASRPGVGTLFILKGYISLAVK